MKVGVIQRVDVGSQALTQCSRQLGPVVDGGNGFEVRPKRGEAFGFDAGLVHVRVVEIGDFAGVGTGRRIGFGRFFNQSDSTFVAQVGERGENANVAAVGRNFRALNPAAVGVLVKILTRLHRGVQVSYDDAVSVLIGRVRECI